MAWNLTTKNNEYLLHKNQSKELIDIFGVSFEYYKIIHQGINSTFSEFQYKESHPNNIFHIMMYPENTESFDSSGDLFSKFGMQIQDSVNFIVSTETFKQIYDLSNFQNVMQAVGDIIKTQRGKLFEVTGIEDEVPGLSNVFTSDRSKNVLMLKCRIYNYKPSDKIPEIIPPEEYDFNNLEAVFNEQKLDQESQTESYVVSRDSVFGDLG